MKRAALTTAVMTAAILLLGCPAPRAQEAENLTDENRAALADAVERLQQTELHRISRGRLKPNPVLFPYHTIYQTVMQDQEYILENQAAAFQNSLLRLYKVFGEYPDISPAAAGGGDVFALCKIDLVSIYSVREELEAQETLLGVWNAFQASEMGMDMLPLRAGLALDAVRWLSRYYGGTIPPEITRQLELIGGKRPTPGSLFEADAYLKELSAEYSRLLLSVVTGTEPEEPAPERPDEPGDDK